MRRCLSECPIEAPIPSSVVSRQHSPGREFRGLRAESKRKRFWKIGHVMLRSITQAALAQHPMEFFGMLMDWYGGCNAEQDALSSRRIKILSLDLIKVKKEMQ